MVWEKRVLLSSPYAIALPSPLYPDHFSEPFLSGKGGQKHGQDQLSGGRRDLDPAVWAETVWDELNEPFEYSQRV